MYKSPEENVKIMKNLIKFNASNMGMNLNMLVEKLHTKYGRTNNPSSFSTRLKKGSLTMLELFEIFDVLNNEFTVTNIEEK